MMKIHDNNNNTHEKRLGKLYETIEDIKSSNKIAAVMPKGMNYSSLKKWVEMMIKDSQPRKIRVDGRTTFDFFDYRIPFDFFGVEANTVNFSLSSGPIFNQDFIGNEKVITTQEILIDDNGKEQSGQPVDEEAENISKSIRKRGGGPGGGGHVRSKKRVNIVTQKSNYTSQIQPNIRSNDYGVMICAHIFKNGRKTIDEMIQDITGIEKHLMTVLINRLISQGYLKKVVEKDRNDDTGEETEVETLELVLREQEQ
jgi:hypothetical protein